MSPALPRALAVVALALCGCSSATDSGAGSIHVGSISIDVLSFPAERNHHQGDTLRLHARVRDIGGNLLSDRPVTWTSRNVQRAAITSDGLLTVGRTVSISQGGIYTDPSRVTIVATAEEMSDSIEVAFNGWSLSVSTDPVALSSSTQGYLSSLVGAEGPPALYVVCSNHIVSAYVAVSFVTANGDVTYRFSGSSSVTETWNEASNFHALFNPAATDTAFARRLTQADSLLFRAHKFQGADVTGTFILRGAAEVMQQIIAACS